MHNFTGRAVRQLRYERMLAGKPYSQVWLAKTAGCSRQTIINLEAGSYLDTRTKTYFEYHPSKQMLAKIARALGVRPADLVESGAERS